jgi:magnesium chelatase family protein
MLARVYTCAVIGLEGGVVEVEVDYAQGFPGITLVGLPDAAVQERVEAARARQRVRSSESANQRSGISSNAEMRPADIRKFCTLDVAGQSLMKSAMNQMQLSGRGYPRVLKPARTIADLAGSDSIQPTHLA